MDSKERIEQFIQALPSACGSCALSFDDDTVKRGNKKIAELVKRLRSGETTIEEEKEMLLQNYKDSVQAYKDSVD